MCSQALLRLFLRQAPERDGVKPEELKHAIAREFVRVVLQNLIAALFETRQVRTIARTIGTIDGWQTNLDDYLFVAADPAVGIGWRGSGRRATGTFDGDFVRGRRCRRTRPLSQLIEERIALRLRQALKSLQLGRRRRLRERGQSRSDTGEYAEYNCRRAGRPFKPHDSTPS